MARQMQRDEGEDILYSILSGGMQGFGQAAEKSNAMEQNLYKAIMEKTLESQIQQKNIENMMTQYGAGTGRAGGSGVEITLTSTGPRMKILTPEEQTIKKLDLQDKLNKVSDVATIKDLLPRYSRYAQGALRPSFRGSQGQVDAQGKPIISDIPQDVNIGMNRSERLETKLLAMAPTQREVIKQAMPTEKAREAITMQRNAEEISKGIKTGLLPPDLNQVASWKDRSAVAAALNKDKVPLAQKRLDWIEATKFAQTKAGPAQVRLVQAISSVTNATDNLRQLNNRFTRTNYAPINKAQIIADANTGNKLAAQYLAQLTVIQDELGQVFMGGNSPTDKTITMAQNLLKSNFSVKQLNAVLDTLDENLKYRLNAINNVAIASTSGEVNPYIANQSNSLVPTSSKRGKTSSGVGWTIGG